MRVSVIVVIICYFCSIYVTSVNEITLAQTLETCCFIFLLLYIGFVIINSMKDRTPQRFNRKEHDHIEKLVLFCLENSHLSYADLLDCIRRELDTAGIFFITERQILLCIDTLLLEEKIFEKNGYFYRDPNSLTDEIKNQDETFLSFRHMQKIQNVLVWGFIGLPLGIIIWTIGALELITIPGYVQIGYILICCAVISCYVSVWLLGTINK